MSDLTAAIGRHYDQAAAAPPPDAALRAAVAHDLNIQRRDPVAADIEQGAQT